jgi:hypothetical protein
VVTFARSMTTRGSCRGLQAERNATATFTARTRRSSSRSVTALTPSLQQANERLASPSVRGRNPCSTCEARSRFRVELSMDAGMLGGRHVDCSSNCGRPRHWPIPGFDLLSTDVGCPKKRWTRSYVWSSGQGPHRLQRVRKHRFRPCHGHPVGREDRGGGGLRRERDRRLRPGSVPSVGQDPTSIPSLFEPGSDTTHTMTVVVDIGPLTTCEPRARTLDLDTPSDTPSCRTIRSDGHSDHPL